MDSPSLLAPILRRYDPTVSVVDDLRTDVVKSGSRHRNPFLICPYSFPNPYFERGSLVQSYVLPKLKRYFTVPRELIRWDYVPFVTRVFIERVT